MKEFINEKCIIRSKEAGVFFGTVKEIKSDSVLLENARKIYYWEGANCVEEISTSGVFQDSSKITVEVSSILIFGVCQILKCTEMSIKCLEECKQWKKS
jgi:hypothetical protein